eukprot:CAMPEP_0117695686 /NCGR_PEP_ID=MMETSP0804-20121206/28272_1 /TAXON_ID=1074897 /ORGANISM="Tetraselmis astigmatica, Strain CCMP880" /LENGTH=187 /DNA_ID=CAMNT_0005509775 /DNA_START=306 /DNA_END=869 /DNA_ORIENTATION=+
MAQCRRALAPDGLFLSAFLGGNTLQEMRIACSIAEMEREGGLSARTSPLAQVSDAGNLLGVGGFALPAVDTDEFQIGYTDVLDLVSHLRRMGAGNAVSHRRMGLPRDTALAAAAVYQSMGTAGEEHSEEATITATFQVVYMAGWSPHPSQQKPKQRGSATASLADLESNLADIGTLHDANEWSPDKS